MKRSSDQPKLTGTLHGLPAATSSNLVVNLTHVPFHRAFLEPEPFADLTVTHAAARQSQNLQLPRRQAARRAVGRLGLEWGTPRGATRHVEGKQDGASETVSWMAICAAISRAIHVAQHMLDREPFIEKAPREPAARADGQCISQGAVGRLFLAARRERFRK